METKQQLEQIGSISATGVDILKYGAAQLLEKVVMRIPVFDSVSLGERLKNEHELNRARTRATNKAIFGTPAYDIYVAEEQAAAQQRKEEERERKEREAHLAELRESIVQPSPPLELPDNIPQTIGMFAITGAEQ
jgi:hypothetical protein